MTPTAWQWLDTAHFRKRIPKTSNADEWRPLFAFDEIERLQAIREAATRIIAAWDAAENQPIGCDLKGGRDYWAAMFAAIDALRERLKSCTP